MKYVKSLLITLLVVIGLGYRSFGANAHSDLEKGVYYDNIKYSDNITFNGVDGTNLDYSAEFNIPGDYYELSFDIVNDTKYDLKITDCILNEDDNYMGYKLTYADGKEVKVGDIIKQGTSKQVKYVVSYNEYIVEDNYQVDTSFYILYGQVI